MEPLSTLKVTSTVGAEIDDQDQKILVESGRNEVEMLEFFVDDRSFGVNVDKIQTLLPYKNEKITPLPETHDAVNGIIVHRDQTIPTVNLRSTLNIPPKSEKEIDERKMIIIILHFNNLTVAVIVDSVNRIHRIGWDQFTPMSQLCTKPTQLVLGSFHKGSRDILVLDFEKIMADIFPTSSIDLLAVGENDIKKPKKQERRDVKIIHVDDSATIRYTIKKILSNAGYTQLTSFTNGLEAFKHLKEVEECVKQDGEALSSKVNIMVIDIEMPKMDGLTLCKRIRRQIGWGKENLPVIMFSSMINKQLADKCQGVGANNQLAKPNVQNLIPMIDSIVGIDENSEEISDEKSKAA